MPDPIPKSPRQRDEVYLNWLRTQPCCICRENTTVEAHHIRIGSINDGKGLTGFGEKSSDKWALPLCGRHHREAHKGEKAFWSSYGLDPFALAMHYHKPRELDPLVKAMRR